MLLNSEGVTPVTVLDTDENCDFRYITDCVSENNGAKYDTIRYDRRVFGFI